MLLSRCKALDGAADGYVRAEACALMILGTAETDTALAVLGASAVNQDGRCDRGLRKYAERAQSLIKQPHGPGSGRVICGQYVFSRPCPNICGQYKVV